MGRRALVVRSQGQGSAAPAGAVPPLARRPVISPASALREEITDSWRLLLGSIGAASAVAGLLFFLATVLVAP